MTTIEASADHLDEHDEPAPRRWRFPSAFSVLFIVTLAVWLIAFVVPTGKYSTDADTGRPMLRLGYDRLVAASVILLGAGIGTLTSTINPFATGVGSGAADISIGDGIGLRLIMYVVLTAVTIDYVVRYARRITLHPEASIVGFRPQDAELARAGTTAATISPRQRLVLWLMGTTFGFMIFAIVPWTQVINGPDADSYRWQLDWYFPELAALFIVMAIVVGLVGGFGEKNPARPHRWLRRLRRDRQLTGR